MKQSLLTIIFFMAFSSAFSQGNTIQNNATTFTTTFGGSTGIFTNHVSNTSPTQNNLALGNDALKGAVSLNFNNTVVGHEAMNRGVQAAFNVAMGNNALYWSSNSSKNVAIGYNAMYSMPPYDGDGDLTIENVAIGYESLRYIAPYSSHNVAVGSQSLRGGAGHSVGIGFQTGYSAGSQLNNIFLGFQAGYNETGSNKLYIESSNSATPLIGGDFANDRVGINRPVASLTNTLEIGGNTAVFGSICYTSYLGVCSDIRYKKNIARLSNSLANVLKINGVSYDLKKTEFPEKNFSDTKQIGFIAQDLEKIYPELVRTDEKGYKSVDYSRMTAILVESVKELNETVEQLKTENKLLMEQNGQINSINNELSAIKKYIKDLQVKLTN
ncbi:tail fiber domain-containing protein [Emticicia sp. SJ17W-69]|uniref:tail fiber domain-containing protein n=1 Tax=Emticicia sp. SJ17W-69 TaxID=3421657 RepID=UPI003EBF6737